MGSTYANVLLREPDIIAVAMLLDQLRRRAYVASDEMGHRRLRRARGCLTRVDDLVAELLGVREFPLFAADRLLVHALGVPTLTAAEKEEYARRDSAFHKRCFDALGRAIAQARKIGPLVG